MRDIFISYVEEDGGITMELAERLETAGYTAWYYERDGALGGDYLLETRNAIDDCQAFVLVISHKSVASKQVDIEVVRAHETNKQFIPLRSNITHAEFAELQPKWAQVLGSTITANIPAGGVSSIAPQMLRGLKELNIKPSAVGSGPLNKPTGPLKKFDPDTGTLRLRTQAVPKEDKMRPASRPKYFIAGGAAAVILIGALLAYFFYPRSQKAMEPALATEFKDLFVDVKSWTPQPPDWLIKNSYLQLKNQNLIYVRELPVEDFTMKFHLKLINAGGAAWALRVKDQNNYYLFYLTGQEASAGPDGKPVTPGYFYFYVIRDGKPLQCNYEPVNLNLILGSEHDVFIEAKGHEIAHNIQPVDDPSDDDKGHILSRFNEKNCRDENSFLPRGSVGFRTVSSEEFLVAELYVWPPGMGPVKLLP